MKFSVVIPTYNYGETLPTAIDSVLSSGRDDIEILVVDDASTDNTPDIVKTYSNRIDYLRLDANCGPAGAWHAGLDQAIGEYVTKLDADDWVLPEFFDRVEAAFDSGVGMVISSVYDYKVASGVAELYPVSDGDKILEPGEFRARLLRSFFFRMPGTALRRSLTLGASPPDRSLRLPHDWEYFIRVTKGSSAALISEPLAVYRVHEGSLTGAARRSESFRVDAEKLIDRVHDPENEACLSESEQKVFRLGLAETYLLIVGAKLGTGDITKIWSDLAFAFGLADDPGNRLKVAAFLFPQLLKKIQRRIGLPRRIVSDIDSLLPPGQPDNM